MSFPFKQLRSRSIMTAPVQKTNGQSFGSPYLRPKNSAMKDRQFVVYDDDDKRDYKKLYHSKVLELKQFKMRDETIKINDLEETQVLLTGEIDRLKKTLNRELNKQLRNHILNKKPYSAKIMTEENDQEKIMIALQQENNKLQGDFELMRYKLERSELLLMEYRQDKRMTQNDIASDKRISTYGNYQNPHQQNLILRIKQKDNKIKHLMNELKDNDKTVVSQIATIQTIQEPTKQLQYLVLRLRYQLIEMKITLDNFILDLMQDKGIDDKINIFQVRFQFQYISDIDAEQFLQQLFKQQVVVNKANLIKRLQNFIKPSYEDLFTRFKIQDQIRIIVEQISLYKEELTQKTQSITVMNVPQFLEILHGTQLQLKPLQNELYEYALMAVSYPSFEHFTIQTALNPFELSKIASQFYQSAPEQF